LAEAKPTGGESEDRAEAPATESKEARGAAASEAKENAKAEREEQVRALEAERRGAKAARAVDATERPLQIREVGFKQLSAVSRVYVRVSENPRFNIVQAGEKLIRVELPNTWILRKNDERFLDTSFFPGAVAMVTPKRSRTGTVLEIALKEEVAYQQRVEGDMLSIDFERPGTLERSAAAPDLPAAEPAAN
jgi:hypothetical protein